MELLIQPPEDFLHAGKLHDRHDSHDPRKRGFKPAELDIDLRECKFVRLPAALWCIVYSSLAVKRGCRCRLLVPKDMSACRFLKTLGFFDALKQLGVDVDDRDIPKYSDTSSFVLPIRHFATTSEATDVTNRAFAGLQLLPVGVANLTSVVTELVGELTMNAAQHSESEVGAYACVNLFGGVPRLTCTIADGGIGVYEHLRRNEKLRSRVNYDWDALELAVRERVSGTGDPHRGIGLYGVSEDVRQPGRSLLLHSGLGSLEINEQLESEARRTRLFPGTLVNLSVPL